MHPYCSNLGIINILYEVYNIITCTYLFFLSAALPEVITRKCQNCSPQQAQSAQKLTSFLQARYPDVWAMLLRKYQNA